MPPATMTSALPVARISCASIAAFMPEPHILFTVVQPVPSGSPAPSEAWRAGACPCPAGSTQPMMTSLTSSGRIFARSTAARMAAAPSSGAAKPFSSPWKAPIGVRAAETMTIGSVFMDQAFQVLQRLLRLGIEARDQFRGGKRAGERHRLGGKSAGGGESGAVPEPAGGNARQLHRRDEHARDGEGAGERSIGVAQIAATVPACFAALGDDEVEAGGLEAFRLGDAIC